MKTIIVPMDFSNESLTGLNMAIMLAKKTGANIVMAHVIGMNESMDEENLEKNSQKAKLKFEYLLKEYSGKLQSDFQMGFMIKTGKVFEEITKLSTEYEDPVTVLSTHGESGFEDLFIGGNAYKITSHSKNPVITVRRSEIKSEVSRIVLPLDITFQTREKVPYTLGIAKLFNSEIHIITVRVTKNKSIEKKLHQYAEQVASYLGKHEISFKIEHLQGNNISDIILDYSKSVSADLISIMTEQDESISNLLLGTNAHQLINKSMIPVLCFPNYQLRIVSDDIWTLGAFNPRN
jgi:nucleotide-binding universal stress UspA family protein